MINKIQGKIEKILPQKKYKPFSPQQFIISTLDRFSKEVCLTIQNGTIDGTDVLVGDLVEVEFTIESVKGDSRWFTTLYVIKIEHLHEVNVFDTF